MKRRIPIVIVLLGGFIPFAALLWFILHPEPITLRWKFAKGKVWRYQVAITTSAITNTCVYSMTVLDVDSSGAATIQCKCEAASTKSQGWDYDSRRDAKEPENPVELAFFARLNKTKTILMNPLGYVLDVDGTPAPFTKQRPSIDSILYPDYLSADGTLVWYLPMPEERVGQGKAWTLVLDDCGSTMPEETRVSRRFRVTDLGPDEAQISIYDTFGESHEDYLAKAGIKSERATVARFSVRQGQLLSYRSEQRFQSQNPERTVIHSQDVQLLTPNGP